MVFGVFRRMARQSDVTEIRSARTCRRFESSDPAIALQRHRNLKNECVCVWGRMRVVLGAELDATTHLTLGLETPKNGESHQERCAG